MTPTQDPTRATDERAPWPLDYPKPWRAGFEVEVVLGDLDDPQFEYANQDVMDMASPRFCQAVARRLRVLTGRRWRAPSRPVRQPGFYVVAEYDLDPLDWPFGIVAGVELITPPLFLPEAERVRSEIRDAIFRMGGDFNFERSDVTDQCAWHVNIDPGQENRIDPQLLMLGVDELSLLSADDRLFSRYAAPQRHAYGVPLLRHLKSDPEARLLRGTGLINLLRHHTGKGKRFAANFAKLERDYLELRYFSAHTFFTGAPLAELIRPITRAFEMGMVEVSVPCRALIRRFQVVREWLDGLLPRLESRIGPMNTIAEGAIFLDGEKIADAIWNGPLELRMTGKRRYSAIATVYDVDWPDIPEAVAIAAMDYAELRASGRYMPPSSSPAFRVLLNDLTRRLKAPSLAMPAPDSSLRANAFRIPSDEALASAGEV